MHCLAGPTLERLAQVACHPSILSNSWLLPINVWQILRYSIPLIGNDGTFQLKILTGTLFRLRNISFTHNSNIQTVYIYYILVLFIGDWLRIFLPTTHTSILDLKIYMPITTFCKSLMSVRNTKRNKNWPDFLRRLVANPTTKFSFLPKPNVNVMTWRDWCVEMVILPW